MNTADEKELKSAALLELPVKIHIDAPNPTAIPASILAGVGNKKARYKSWLDRAFTDDTGLLRFLAFIYKTMRENSKATLVCQCKSALPGKHYHADTIEEWLNENHETLDTLLPYLFDKAEQEVNAGATPTPTIDAMAGSLTGEQAIAQGIITASDLEQMKAVIENDTAEKGD